MHADRMDCRVKPGNDEAKRANPCPVRACYPSAMQDFPIVPPLVVKDTPKPR
jgi:hypothetical protein